MWNILKYESAHHRIISLLIHLCFVVYLIGLLYAERMTPKPLLIGTGIFVIIYGVSIVSFGFMFR